ncbi:exodeoxyribonuclease VII small subunit [Clostridium hydrogenum]|uniref:exodeoxyribonuclease VII small subunit n=1 Tax=Clostridium hydrogenum TaxID=2855764 RepID=UPI001F2068D3|nr:exodeoxyribonuclease VII small subunit [Clostridium hydrogenum]
MASKKDSYEGMMEKLEKILADMEDGNLSLEKTLKHYEEGMELYNKLYKTLNEAEGKIKVLTENGEKDFLKESDTNE